MNHFIVVGNLAADAETKKFENSFLTKFTVIENSGDYKDKEGNKVAKPESFQTEYWTKFDPAELAKHLTKGKGVAVHGRMENGSYEKEGTKHYTITLKAGEVQFV